MANTQKFRAHESLAIESAGDWQTQTPATVGSSASAVFILLLRLQVQML